LTHKPTIIKKGRGRFYPRHYRMPVFAGQSIENRAEVRHSLNKHVIAEVQPPSYFRPPKGAKPEPRWRHVNDKHHVNEHHKHRFADVDTVADEELAADVHMQLPGVPSEADLPALQLENPAAVLQETQEVVANELHANPEALEAVDTFFAEVKGLLRK